MTSLDLSIDAFLADSLETIHGKFYGMGIGWTILNAPGFPFLTPNVNIGILIHIPYNETDKEHVLSIHLQTEDGIAHKIGEQRMGDAVTPIYEITTSFGVGRPENLPEGDEQAFPVSISLGQIVFDAPGMYTWILTVDGEPLKRLPMRVLTIQS